MDTETQNWLEEAYRIRLKAASVTDLEEAIGAAIGKLIGGRYKAQVDSIEFERNLLSPERAKMIVRLERTETYEEESGGGESESAAP